MLLDHKQLSNLKYFKSKFYFTEWFSHGLLSTLSGINFLPVWQLTSVILTSNILTQKQGSFSFLSNFPNLEIIMQNLQSGL